MTAAQRKRAKRSAKRRDDDLVALADALREAWDGMDSLEPRPRKIYLHADAYDAVADKGFDMSQFERLTEIPIEDKK